MKIIIDGMIYSSAPTGGVYRYFNEIIPRLSAFPDTEIKIFSPKNATSIPTGNHITVEKDRLPSGSWLPESELKKTLRKVKQRVNSFLMSKKFSGVKDSVFHSTYYTPSPWPSLPQVVTVHDMISELFPETYHLPHVRELRENKAKCLMTATRVIAISEQTKKDLQRIYNISASNIDVIYHGVDFELFSHKKEESNQKNILRKLELTSPYFLFLGGRLHHKNFSTLLKAFASRPLSKEYILAVAGTPWTQEESELIKSLNISSRLAWMPSLDETDLPTVYQNATALALPSYYEGFGLPLIEAMAAGCPVVASQSGPFPELAEGAAIFFDPFDPSQMGLALEKVLVPSTRNELIEKGKKQAAKFSWDLSAKKHFESYHKALKGDA